MKIILASPYLRGLVMRHVERHFPDAAILEFERGGRAAFGLDAAGFQGADCILFSDGASSNAWRMDAFSRLVGNGAKLHACLFDGAIVAGTARVGLGTLIYPHAILDADVRIGFDTLIGPNTVIEAGCEIGNHCFIGSNVVVKAGSRIGNGVYVTAGCQVGGLHGFEPAIEQVSIGRGVIINDVMAIREDIPAGVIIDAKVGNVIRVFR